MRQAHGQPACKYPACRECSAIMMVKLATANDTSNGWWRPSSAMRQAHGQQARLQGGTARAYPCDAASTWTTSMRIPRLQRTARREGRPAPALDAARLVAGGVERHGQAHRGGGGRREVERHQQRVAAGAPQRPPRQLAQLQRERRRPPARGQRPRLRLQRRRPRQVVRCDAGPAAAQPESCFVTARHLAIPSPAQAQSRELSGGPEISCPNEASLQVHTCFVTGSFFRRRLSQQIWYVLVTEGNPF